MYHLMGVAISRTSWAKNISPNPVRHQVSSQRLQHHCCGRLACPVCKSIRDAAVETGDTAGSNDLTPAVGVVLLLVPGIQEPEECDCGVENCSAVHVESVGKFLHGYLSQRLLHLCDA